MTDDSRQNSGINAKDSAGTTRRDFLKKSALAAASSPIVAGALASRAQAEGPSSSEPPKKPNILIVHSDQFRWDFIGEAGHNPMAITPNLDAMYRRGTVFENFITNQPLCSPSRACLWTGQYATTNGVWKLPWSDKPRVAINPNAVTLATQLRDTGYSTNYIGKWHLAPLPHGARGEHLGFVPKQYRTGFDDLWQAANVLELTSHPYHGTIWDGDGTPMHYKDEYRVDYLTDLTVNFLRKKQDKPFCLVVSQLEPHQQNDLNGFGPPHGSFKKLQNPYVPPDLKALPGDWPYQLSNYYGDITAIDASMGRIFKTLQEEGLEDNTVVVFLSDHGCHFRTRNEEYKRSPHDASTHVPLMIQGPGFNNGQRIRQQVNMIDVTPSLLDLVGLKTPTVMQGQSFLPLMHSPKARDAWRDEVFIQVSESEMARALRTPEWTYVALAPNASPFHDKHSLHYQDYQLYNNYADPAQVVNLCGRNDPPGLVHFAGDRSMREITDHLRELLTERIAEAGEPKPTIQRWNYYA
jgi:arylsulfatase A-like enzyme